MVMGGDGPWAIAVMWALTAVTFICVSLRVYTRVVVVKSFGIDDHVYNLSFVFLFFYTLFTTVAAHHGFGQDLVDISNRDPEDVPLAILYEAIGQTFAVVGMAVAKWSLGLFLLRLVEGRWHKISVWCPMASLMGASICTCFVFWLQCSPPRYLWDRRIPGHCHVDSTPVSMLLCILCVIVDFFYAGFPWLFIWKLQMNGREKILILLSLSLGVIAGACGIKRTIEVPELSSPNYTKDTVGLIVWSAAEIAVTMICIGIPVCVPLYKRYREKSTAGDTSNYRQQSEGGVYGLKTIGGSTLRPGAATNNNYTSGSGDFFTEVERHHVVGDPSAISTTCLTESFCGDGQSQEGILGPGVWQSQDDLEAQIKGSG